MRRKPPAQRLISALSVIPALLIGTHMLPANSQEPIEIAQLLNSTSPQDSNAQTITQNFFMLLVQQKYEEASQYLSPSLRNYSSATQLQQAWQNFLAKLGNFVKIQQIYPSELLGTYNVLVTIQFQNSTQDLVLTLDENQKITTVDFLRLGNIQTNAEKFADAISQGEYAVARSYLSPELKQKFSPETIQQRWMAILAKTGAFKQRTTSSVLRGDAYDVVSVNLEFANYSGRFLVFFNPLGQIIGFDSPFKPQP